MTVQTRFVVYELTEGIWTWAMREGEQTLLRPARDRSWATQEDAFTDCCRAKASLEQADREHAEIDVATDRGREIHDYIQRAANVHLDTVEHRARETARLALRPRLRWTIAYPRILDAVYKLGLARRPQAVYSTGLFDGKRYPVIPLDDPRSTMVVVNPCVSLVRDETSPTGMASCDARFVDLRGNCERCRAHRVDFV